MSEPRNAPAYAELPEAEGRKLLRLAAAPVAQQQPVRLPQRQPEPCGKCGAGWQPHVCGSGPDWD